MKPINNAIDKYMDEDERGEAGQIITILPICRDPRPDIGLNPRNNWCMQSQIGSQPKIWAHYFIRWSHILCAKNYLCVQHRNSNPVSPDNVWRFQTLSETVWLTDRKHRPPLNASMNQNVRTSNCWFCFLFFKLNGLFMCVCTCLCVI